VVIDINLPEMDGTRTIRQIKQIRPTLPVIVLSFQSDIRYLQESVKAGASGYVLKERAYEDLVEAIKSVAEHTNFFSIDLVP
jgi:DNA-binding NarL/FixJ family response regulator